MDTLYKKLLLSIKHLSVLDDVFKNKTNYSNERDYNLYIQNITRFKKLCSEIKLDKELYSKNGRQMQLADILEYMFFSRGIFSLINGNNQLIHRYVPKYIELILRFVNMLILYEIMTVDNQLRQAFVSNLGDQIDEVAHEDEYLNLKQWQDNVGLRTKDPAGAPSKYFDSILPKTAGGLWHEMLVYAFILRFNIGYIFPLLLHQKILSLDSKLSPPDLVILHKATSRYYGIEIGDLKERQSGGFMAPSGIPVIPINTRDNRSSDRCPICNKWIGLCPKIIEEFSDPAVNISRVEIRCLYDCDKYTLKAKIYGECPYMKYYDRLHNHFTCLVEKKKDELFANVLEKHKLDEDTLNNMIADESIKNLPCDSNNIRSKKINYIITHHVWYPELATLI